MHPYQVSNKIFNLLIKKYNKKKLSKVGVPPAKNSSTPLESTTMESMSATSSLKSVHTELTKADLDQDAARNDANKLHRAFEGNTCN